MIDLRYSKKGTPYVWASEIFEELRLPGNHIHWFQAIVNKREFIVNTHYWQFHRDEQKEDGTICEILDWSVQLEMAKRIALDQDTDRSRTLRNYLLFLESRVSEGELLTNAQIGALWDIAEALALFSVQKHLESKHFEQFVIDSHSNEWWEYRAKLFGITIDDIKAILANYGIEYQNHRQALFHIDRYELVRRAATDLFKLMGKSDQYAVNMGKTAKMLASRSKVSVYNDLDISLNFLSEQQQATVEQVKNYKNESTLLKKFS